MTVEPDDYPPLKTNLTEDDKKQERVALTQEVLGVLNTWDPLKVSPGDFAPDHHYEAEARLFAEMLHTTGAVNRADIRNVGAVMFRDPDWCAGVWSALLHELTMLAASRSWRTKEM